MLLTTGAQQGKELSWQQSSLFVLAGDTGAWGPAGEALSIVAGGCSAGKGLGFAERRGMLVPDPPVSQLEEELIYFFPPDMLGNCTAVG